MHARRALIPAALLLACLGLGLGADRLRARALEERSRWPAAAEIVLLPAMAPVFRGLLGRELTASVLWCRGLVYYGSARALTGDYRQLEEIIDAILASDPHFYRVYRWAGYAVTFATGTATQEEYRLSLRYLEQGIEVTPDDWELYWIAGLRYFLDLQPDDPEERQRLRERGADLIQQAIHKPNAPPDLATLAATLNSRIGRHEHAVASLREMILTTDNPRAQERMLGVLKSLGGDPGLVDEIRRARRAFDDEWKDNHPLLPPSLYLLLGPRPRPFIDPEELANPPELFILEPLLGDDEDDDDDDD